VARLLIRTPTAADNLTISPAASRGIAGRRMSMLGRSTEADAPRSQTIPPPHAWLRTAAIVAAGAVAFLLVPGSATFAAGLNPSFLLRGALAGAVVGLSVARDERRARVVVLGALAACAGAALMLDLIVAAGAWVWAPAGVATAAGSASAFLRWRERSKPVAVAGMGLAIVLGGSAWTFGVLGGPYAPLLQERLEEWSVPVVPEHYAFDGEIYRRTRALMRRGDPYYAAFQQAWTEDKRFDGTIATPLGFREPALFYLWQALPGGNAAALLGWFIAFAFGASFAAWMLARACVGDGPALLAPIGVLSYATFFVFSQRSWFTFAEPWAAWVMIAALALLVRRRTLPAALCLVLAVAFRELAGLYVAAWAVQWVLSGRPRRTAPALLVACVGSVAVLLLHVTMAPASGGSGHLALATWLHSTGVPRLLRALQHGMTLVPHGNVLSPLFLVAALVGAWSLPERAMRWTLTTAILLPATFLLAVSADAYDYYWGAILTPLLLALAPFVWSRVLPAESVPHATRQTTPPERLAA
jgi:hypothetical protein